MGLSIRPAAAATPRHEEASVTRSPMCLEKRHGLAGLEENFVHLDLGANLAEMDFVVFIRAKMALLVAEGRGRGGGTRESRASVSFQFSTLLPSPSCEPLLPLFSSPTPSPPLPILTSLASSETFMSENRNIIPVAVRTRSSSLISPEDEGTFPTHSIEMKHAMATKKVMMKSS
jgi:hypothetical protein